MHVTASNNRPRRVSARQRIVSLLHCIYNPHGVPAAPHRSPLRATLPSNSFLLLALLDDISYCPSSTITNRIPRTNMMHTSNMLFLATLALFALVIPVARGADHQVTVGGIGILKYDPEFVVRMFSLTSCYLHSTELHRRQILETPSPSSSIRRTTLSLSRL